MNILVCIKQVPDDSVEVGIGADGKPAIDSITKVVNAFDTYALEMAARYKEALGDDSEITVLCVGPDEAKNSLKPATNNIEESSFFTGKEATDAALGQTGIYLAEQLNTGVITNVIAIDVKDGKAVAKQETDEGYRMVE